MIKKPVSHFESDSDWEWVTKQRISLLLPVLANGLAVLEVCDESRSLGRSSSALTACYPRVISVDAHSISGALTFTVGANAAHICWLQFERGFPRRLVTVTGKLRAASEQLREKKRGYISFCSSPTITASLGMFPCYLSLRSNDFVRDCMMRWWTCLAFFTQNRWGWYLCCVLLPIRRRRGYINVQECGLGHR